MDFEQIIRMRHSTRNYNQLAISDNNLNKILYAAHMAPSAHNLQPVHLIVIKTEEGKIKLAKGANIYNAPLAVIVCVDRSKAWKRSCDKKSSGDIDASIITDHMMLQATELGISSVWICDFRPDIISNEFNLPIGWEPINILALGYTDIDHYDSVVHEKTRKPLEELVIIS